MNCCPSCGRGWPKPKALKMSIPAKDTAAMSEAELIAYYKRISPIEDVRFHMNLSPQAEILSGFHSLLEELEEGNGKHTIHTRQRYLELTQQVRESYIRHTGAKPGKGEWKVLYRHTSGQLYNKIKGGLFDRAGWGAENQTPLLIRPMPKYAKLVSPVPAAA